MAQDFSQAECKVIAAVASKVVKAVGKDTLSLAFRQSFRNWLGTPLTCQVPVEIRTPTGPDIDAWNTIRTVLGSGDQPIDLLERGVKAVK